MQIAVLPPFDDGTSSALKNFFFLHPLQSLLSEYSISVLTAPSEKRFDLYLCVGDRFLSDGFWDSWILGQPQKASAVALSASPGREWDARAKEKLRNIGKLGGVNVLDEPSLKKVREAVAFGQVSVGASPTLFSSAEPFLLAQSTRIFVPALSDPAFADDTRAFRKLIQRFYARLNHQGRALFLVQDPAELDRGALPGISTLLSPSHPSLYLKALASASSVVGFHSSFLMAAVACGVPAVFIGSDPAERNAIESAGIPFLEIHLNTDPAELDHRVEEVVRRYPWETIRAKSQRLREGLVEHLKSLGLRVRVAQSTREPARSAAKKHRIEGSLPKLAVATIVSPSALPSFIGLFENLQQTTDRPLHHHVLALDRSTELHLQKTFENKPVSVYCPSDLWPETDKIGRAHV